MPLFFGETLVWTSGREAETEKPGRGGSGEVLECRKQRQGVGLVVEHVNDPQLRQESIGGSWALLKRMHKWLPLWWCSCPSESTICGQWNHISRQGAV